MRTITCERLQPRIVAVLLVLLLQGRGMVQLHNCARSLVHGQRTEPQQRSAAGLVLGAASRMWRAASTAQSSTAAAVRLALPFCPQLPGAAGWPVFRQQ